MSTGSEFQTRTRPSRLYLGTLVFLWAVFGFFTLSQLLRKESASADPEKLKELQQVALAPEKPSTSDWPQWRGPNRDGLSSDTGLLTTWPQGGPPKLWEVAAGPGFSSLAVAQGRVVTMFQDKDQEVVAGWDEATGRELWRHGTPASFRHSFGDGPRSTPTIDDDRIYSVGATGNMACLKIKDGQVVWTKPLLEEFGARNLEWGTSVCPLVDADLVYVDPGGPDGHGLVALDKFTGAVRWQALDDAASNSSPVLATIAGQRQLVFFTEKGLVAVTPDEGKLLWRFPWTTDFGANVATPIIANDYVFISSGYGKGCALVKVEKGELGLSARQVYKNLKMKNHFATCVLYQEHLYGFNDTTLTCMEFRTGKVAWTERGFDKGSLTIAEGHLFILSEYGILAVAPATPEGYRENSRFQFSSKRTWTVPVVCGGRLFIRDEEKVSCFDVRASRKVRSN